MPKTRLENLTATTGGAGSTTLENITSDGTDLPIINIKSTPTGATVGTIVLIEADGSNWSSGSRVIKIVADDDDAIPLLVNDGASDTFYVNRDGSINMDSDISIGGRIYNPSAVLNLGTSASSSHSLGVGDVLVGGKLEVGAPAFFDSSLNVSSGLTMGSHMTQTAGKFIYAAAIADDTVIELHTIHQTNDSLAIWGRDKSRYTMFADFTNQTVDYGHSVQENPTIFIHSSTSDTTEYLGLQHHTGGAKIWNGKGDIVLEPAGDVTISGTLRATNILYADSVYTQAGAGGLGLNFGDSGSSSYAGGFRWGTDDGLRFFTGHGDCNKNIIITAAASSGFDHDHDTASPDPTMFFHSATNPDTDNTQWGSLAHDKTNFVISSGKGEITLNPSDGTTVSGLLTVEDRISGEGSDPLNLGTAASSSHSLGSGDVLVGGKLEVNGTLYTDYSIQICAGAKVYNSKWLSFGTTDAGYIGFNTTNDALQFGIDPTEGTNFIFSSGAYLTTNYDHTFQDNPTIFIQSFTSPDIDNTEYLGLTHSNSGAKIWNGKGDIVLEPAGDVTISGALNAQNVEIDGTLTVTGTVLTHGSVDMRGLVENSEDALNLGTAASSSQGLGVGDVLVGGKLEVDGASYFDGNSWFYDAIVSTDDLLIGASSSTDYGVIKGKAGDGFVLAIGARSSKGGRRLLIIDGVNTTVSYGHAVQENPTIFIHSSTSDTTEYLLLFLGS
jgi:hypothetical protein